ncbi:MAG: type II toxin-antitoxin system RelE/ParE family toxin [Cytophagales bacterium]|nr:type II toxin-antitoxin system RelE/ParE family toxin [Cytophagales bacterium]
MVKGKKRVVWSPKAIDSLKWHYKYIAKDSVSAAKKVKQEIINASKELNQCPERFAVDEYYPSNPGNIRRFFRWSYRVIYEVNENTIDILNVVHTSQEPIQK